MKFLADENLEYSIISFLREKNVDIVAVRDIMKGAPNSEIIKYALENNLIILTSDKDFGELTFRLQKSNHGIILLRFSEINTIEKAKILWAAIEKIGNDAAGKFIVVQKNSIRIKPLLK
jgi:predicted nuclease of predicted toxin-antitoxin system